MSTQMKIIAAKQMGQEATKKASAGAGALTRFVRENNWSVRGLSFLGSLAMIILSILKLINFFGVLTDFFGYVINVYSLLFAYVMLMIEAKNEWPLVEIFIGGIWMTTSSLWVFWIGIYVIIIGVLYIITHLGGCCGSDRDAHPHEAPVPVFAPGESASAGMPPSSSRSREPDGGYFRLFFAEYISPQGAVGLKLYKYQATNTSIWYNNVAGPLAGWLVDKTPRWIAPNVITLIGFACVLVAYELVYFFCPTFTEQAPSWVWLVVSALLFTYRTLDNMDGKQARKLGCGTPLGLSLDHGCDAVTCCLIPAIGCAFLQLGLTFWTVLFVVIPPITAFFLTWEEFYTGVFSLGSFNGVDEGGIITDAVFFVGGMMGEKNLSDFFSQEISPYSIQMRHACVLLVLVLSVYTIAPAIVTVVRTEKWKKAMFKEFNDSVETVEKISRIVTTDEESKTPSWSARHYHGKRPRVRDAFGAVLPVLLGSALWTTSVCLPFKQSRVLLQHTRIMIWLAVMLFSKLITHLHVAHVCGDPYYQWRKTFLIPVGLITANSVYSDYISSDGSTIVDELWLLYACATIATISWVHMAYSVVTGMCRVLNIPFLRVPDSCLPKSTNAPKNSTKKAPKRKKIQ